MSKEEHKQRNASESKVLVTARKTEHHQGASVTTSSHRHEEHQGITLESTIGSGGMHNKWGTTNTRDNKEENGQAHSDLKYESEFGSITPRIAVAHTSTGRLSGGYSGAGTRNLAILTDSQYFGISPDMADKATKSFVASTGRESTTMQGLNERLAAYVARIQELESANQKVYDDWEAVSKATITTDTNKYTQYTDQLVSLRSSINMAFVLKAKVEAEKLALEAELRNYRFRYEEIQSDNLQLSKYKTTLMESSAEADKLQARFKQLSGDLEKFSNDNKSGWYNVRMKNEEWRKVMQDCVAYKYQSHTQMDELMTFVHDVQEQMVMKLEKKTHIAHQQPSTKVKDDLAQAIRDITVEYEVISEQAKAETKKWYDRKRRQAEQLAERKKKEKKLPDAKMDRLKEAIETVHSNIAYMEREVIDLEQTVQRRKEEFNKLKLQHEKELFEHETRMHQKLEVRQRMAITLQSIFDTNQLHETEIAIYRTMLEGEEKRIGIVKPAKQRPHITRQNTMAVSTRAFYKTESKQNVRIKFCDLLGEYIILENISSPAQDQNIGGWQVHRQVDQQPKVDYTIPAHVTLKTGESIEIYSKGHGHKHIKPNALIFEEATWGAGIHIVTTLWNKDGVEVASHIQRPEETGDDPAFKSV